MQTQSAYCFLVDTKNLGEQAEQEFMAYTPNDDNRKFNELYNARRLSSSYVPKDAQVCICTIQRMYSILKGEELDEALEEINPAEQYTNQNSRCPSYITKKYHLNFLTLSLLMNVTAPFTIYGDR